jgi:hypothetical protein
MLVARRPSQGPDPPRVGLSAAALSHRCACRAAWRPAAWLVPAAAQPARHGTLLAPGTLDWPVRSSQPVVVDTTRNGRSLVSFGLPGSNIVMPMDGEVIHIGELDTSRGAGLVIRHAPHLYHRSALDAGPFPRQAPGRDPAGPRRVPR